MTSVFSVELRWETRGESGVLFVELQPETWGEGCLWKHWALQLNYTTELGDGKHAMQCNALFQYMLEKIESEERGENNFVASMGGGRCTLFVYKSVHCILLCPRATKSSLVDLL